MISVPNTIIFMGGYEEIKNRIRQLELSIPINVQSGLAAGAARLISTTMTTPLELIRTIQTGGLQSNAITTRDILVSVLKSKGLSGLYVVSTLSLLKNKYERDGELQFCVTLRLVLSTG